MKKFAISVVLLFLMTGQIKQDFRLMRTYQSQNQLNQEKKGSLKMSINKDQLRELIIETLKEVDLHSDSAVELLMGTAAVESNLGEYIKQVNGPALGIFQMEPETYFDIWENYLKFKPMTFSKNYNIEHLQGKQLYKHGADTMRYNLKYAIIMTRLHYLRRPEPLPKANDIEGLAYYWKSYFNTRLGKGKQTDFIDKYIKYVKG